MSKSRFSRFGKNSRHSKNSGSRPRQTRRGGFEMLEPRWVLSAATVGIGAPVLVAFSDPTATVGTTIQPNSTNPDVTATVLKTTESENGGPYCQCRRHDRR